MEEVGGMGDRGGGKWRRDGEEGYSEVAVVKWPVVSCVSVL